MSIRRVRVAVAAFFLVYLLVVTWPLGTVFGAAEPFVLGFPFSFFWPALWIVMGGIALALLDRAEDRERRDRSRRRRPGAGSPADLAGSEGSGGRGEDGGP